MHATTHAVAQAALIIAIAGAVVVLLAGILLWIARRKDDANWVLERAPLLPIGLLYAGGLKLGFPRPARGPWSPPQAILSAFLGLCGFVALWTLYVFNTMILYRNRTKTAFKQIDVDLKQRFDLIPGLCEVITGATEHERALFEELARLRAELTGASASTKIEKDAEVTGRVDRLIAMGEAYPELTINPLFLKLHRELTALEEKIAHARTFFNGCATEYNTFISQMPRSLVAGLCGFRDWPLFQSARRP